MRLRPNSFFLLTFMLLTAVANAQAATTEKGGSEPAFTKEFVPDTIGPGSTSTLVFTIDNTNGPFPLILLAFSDTLPAGVNLAAPAFVSNTCTGVGAMLTAPDGGDTITLSGGELGAGETCEVVVNVVGDGPAAAPVDVVYTNTTGDLTYLGGNSGTATDDLMVDIDRPGFSKSFAPSTVEFGGRSTLTFTIDNQLNANSALLLSFTDSLPAGMVVASPSNATTDCDFSVEPALTAAPGSSSISLSNGGVDTASSCTVAVDVIGGAIGSLDNVSAELSAFVGFTGLLSGKAAAVLEVTGVEDLLELSKEFIDDPVAPGGTVTLEFTVTNKSRADAATEINFSDNLAATLAGLTATSPPDPDPPCGAGSSLAVGSSLILSNGSLPPEGSCTFSVELAVPAAAAPGAYPNTAGPVSGLVGGSPETGNTAGDLLFVVSFPVLTKEFTDDPVAAGGTVTLEFTITNPEDSSTMSGITFVDELTDNSGGLGGGGVGNGFLPVPVAVTLPPTPNPPCGMGSSLALVSLGTDRQGLDLTGGSLAAAGMAGDSCTFAVTIDIPAGFPGGIYTNTTEPISAVLDDLPGPPTMTGSPASDDIVVVGAPRLTKEFTDDPVPPGGTVTLEFTLTYDPPGLPPFPDATLIAFSDDLGATLTGLTLTSVLMDSCGGTVGGVGTDMFSYSGGSLTAGSTCTISLELTVPTMVGGSFGNTTSEVTADVDGLATTSVAATDDLTVSGLLLTKEFTDDPVIPGGTATLRFTLDNVGAVDATGILFTDNLASILPGAPDVMAAAPLPDTSACGAGSSITGTTFLIFSNGSVDAGTSCFFDVIVDVPAGAADGTYFNVSGPVSSSLGSGPSATDTLTIDSILLALTKEFTDDPVEPGDTVSLEFNLENLSATETVTDIAFDDDLDAALSGLEATGATVNTCGGMAAGFPAGLFEYSGGTLTPGASCMIALTVDVPLGPLPGDLFTNTTTGVTGKVGALDVFGDPASDDLDVDLLVFSKAFNGATSATGTAVLTFTIENLDTVNGITELAFFDDLDAVVSGLMATMLPSAPCGVGSSLSGTSFLALTGASLPAGGTCSFDVTVAVPGSASIGDFLNTTSALFSGGEQVAPPATALLTIRPQGIFANSFED